MNFADIKRMLGAFSAKDTYDIVPPMGISAQLTFLTSAAMAFLAVFALALLAATERLADRWGSELSQSSTVRISAPPDQAVAQINATLTILEQTAGVASARALTVEEQQALLAPWLGPDLPLDDLPVPQLIEIVEDGDGYDVKVCVCACVPRCPAPSLTITPAGVAPLFRPHRGCGSLALRPLG